MTDEMIPTQRVLLVGNSGSGKTTGAWRWYLSRIPRRIILDQTGEWHGYVDVVTSTLPAFVEAVRQHQRIRKWTISYTLMDDRFDDLAHWLVPVPNVDDSPILTLGGAAILIDEADLVAPQHNTSRAVRTLYRRSRHVGLTIISATQRPGNVSREVSAQSTHILAYYLSEPRDRDYVADIMRWDSQAVDRWLEWTRQHPHGAAWKEVQTGRLLWIPETGQPVAPTASQAADVSASDVQPVATGQPTAQPLPARQRQPTQSLAESELESQDDDSESN